MEGPIGFSLEIISDDSCIYEGSGVQTFFIVSCRGQHNGSKYDIYFKKIIDGVYYPDEWIDKNKPIMTLFYKNNKLYTDEGQLNKAIKGGQLLFKKVNTGKM